MPDIAAGMRCAKPLSGLLERRGRRKPGLENLEVDNIQLREENAALRLERIPG